MKSALTLLCLMFSRVALAQACPSYSASSAGNTKNCAINAVPGTNPTTTEWQAIFDLAAKGPTAWTDGPAVSDLKQGCAAPVLIHAEFPCELLKAIAMQESSWRQFCVPTSPADQVGKPSQTIIAFDCGYGIGQVTSGMRTTDPMPNFDRQRVAAEPFYNLASGLQILSDKWRIASCVGDRQPARIEHWYIAAWAYNGLSSVNNPNRTGSSTRGVWNPRVGGTVPYQERVWGWMEYPPTPAHWPVTKVAYPKLTDVGANTPPPALPDPTCASPTDCTATRPSIVSSCLGGSTDGGTLDGGSHDPVLFGKLNVELGPPGRACGCSSGGGALALFAVATVRKRQSRNRRR